MDATETRTWLDNSLAGCLVSHTTISGSRVVLSGQYSDVFRELKAACHSLGCTLCSASDCSLACAPRRLRRAPDGLDEMKRECVNAFPCAPWPCWL